MFCCAWGPTPTRASATARLRTVIKLEVAWGPTPTRLTGHARATRSVTGWSATILTMQFAICNELFEGWSFDRVCGYVKSAGYDGLEVAPFTLAPRITDLTTAARARLRAQAADAGIEIIGLHWLLAKTDGFYLTSPDDAVRARTTAYFVALTEACRDLGGRLMVLGSPKQRSRLPGVSRDQAFDLAAETLRPVLPVLESAGVTLCLEPLVAGRDGFSEHVRRGAGAGGATRSPERRAASRREGDGERANADRRSRARARGRRGPFPRQRRQPARPGVWRHRLRADLRRPRSRRLRQMGVGRSVRLFARS